MAGPKHSIQEILEQDGVWISTTAGTSMWPMLRDRRDTIVVRPVEGSLRPYDVALYRRDNAYILHRVIKATASGYRIIGDNCMAYEEVPESNILGRLDEFWRGERRCDPRSDAWLLYARAWHALLPIRKVLKRIQFAAKRVAQKIGLR